MNGIISNISLWFSFATGWLQLFCPMSSHSSQDLSSQHLHLLPVVKREFFKDKNFSSGIS